MKILDTLASQPARLWKFLGFFQGPTVRVVHAAIVLFVLVQFFSSSLMSMRGGVSLFGWLHIASGITLCFLALTLTGLSLWRHGIRHFFPYLWGDIEQLRKDARDILRFKLVPPRPGGLGATVQGLGLGALWLVAGSGLLWFILWQSGSEFAWYFRSLHKEVAILIGIYFVGHGGMALIHFAAWQREISRRQERL